MSKSRTFWVVLWLGIVAALAWLVYHYSEISKRLMKLLRLERNQKHEIYAAYLTLLERHIETEQNVDVSIIEEFQKLKKKVDILDYQVHIELEGIVNDLTGGRAVNALRRIAKIIENKLREKANNDPSFTGNKMLANLLNYGKSHNWITDGQYENMKILKDVRNEESHELAVFKDSVKIGLCIYSGIDVLQSIDRTPGDSESN